MDREILNYLDKVGKYLQGAGEKGFETYVHGVFVNSLVQTISGILLVTVSIYLVRLAIKYWNIIVASDMEIYTIAIPVILTIGVVTIGTNVTGVFAPDYMAIKEIVDKIGGE